VCADGKLMEHLRWWKRADSTGGVRQYEQKNSSTCGSTCNVL
jgi:hypothetical protein